MIAREPFGRTGHESSRVLFGAAALGSVSQETADSVLSVLLEFGVNHLDTAFSYGEAERRIAPWLVAHPGEFFLATKTAERTGDGARAGLEASLDRLGVDRVDLVQLHDLVEEDDWQLAHGPGGAVEALVQAREEGLTRFIGVTGHGLRIARMHLRSLERFDFDSVLFPYNYSLLEIATYRADVEELIAECERRSIAIQTMKSIARRRWSAEGSGRSWYEPLADPDAISRAVRFVLSRPGVFLASSSDYELLRFVLEAASEPVVAPGADELVADADRLEVAALFDGAAHELM